MARWEPWEPREPREPWEPREPRRWKPRQKAPGAVVEMGYRSGFVPERPVVEGRVRGGLLRGFESCAPPLGGIGALPFSVLPFFALASAASPGQAACPPE